MSDTNTILLGILAILFGGFLGVTYVIVQIRDAILAATKSKLTGDAK